MPEFILDTSGAVIDNRPGWAKHPVVYWHQLDPFTQGYIEALVASMQDTYWTHSQPGYIANDRWVIGFSDLAPETLARIIEDCAAIKAHLDETWAAAMKWSKAEQHPDFPSTGQKAWAWRQAGFARQMFPPLALTLTLTIGDDGKVYLT